MWSNGTQTQNESWVRFDNWNTQVAFPKGKRLTIKFTRSGGDSIRYYYDHSDPYKFGEMPNDIDPNPADLCMRVYGRMNAVDSADWCSSPSSLTTAA